MRPVFEILPNVLSVNTEQSELFVELSTSGISYAVQQEKDNCFCGVALYHFDNRNNPAEIAKEVEKAFLNNSFVNNTFSQVTIIYAFAESILVPSKVYSRDEAETGLPKIFGDLFESKVFHEEVPGMDIINVYRVPLEIEKVVKDEFPDYRQFHQSTLLVKQLPKEGEELKAIFHPGFMTAIVSRNGKLQFIQEFRFESVEDATWHLLNVCARFDLENPVLKIGGMINQDSPLYLEIRKYFKNVQFDKLPAGMNYDEAITQMPEHFFSYLFSSALCV